LLKVWVNLSGYHIGVVILGLGELLLLQVLLLGSLNVNLAHDFVEVIHGELATFDFGLVLPVDFGSDCCEHIPEDNDNALGRKLLFKLNKRCSNLLRDIGVGYLALHGFVHHVLDALDQLATLNAASHILAERAGIDFRVYGKLNQQPSALFLVDLVHFLLDAGPKLFDVGFAFDLA
jgi:hypothetical protein